MDDQQVQKLEMGMWARVRDPVPGEKTFEEVVHFVASDQVDFAQNKASIDSPLGEVLSGAKVNDIVRLKTDSGEIGLVVLELGHS